MEKWMATEKINGLQMFNIENSKIKHDSNDRDYWESFVIHREPKCDY